jgi:hypothetical protein
VQDGHDDLGGGSTLLWVDICGDPAAIVGDRDAFVGVYGDNDTIAMARQGLIDRIVDNLENHVVQARAIVGVADVHSRALPHRIKSLQDFDFA